MSKKRAQLRPKEKKRPKWGCWTSRLEKEDGLLVVTCSQHSYKLIWSLNRNVVTKNDPLECCSGHIPLPSRQRIQFRCDSHLHQRRSKVNNLTRRKTKLGVERRKRYSYKWVRKRSKNSKLQRQWRRPQWFPCKNLRGMACTSQFTRPKDLVKVKRTELEDWLRLWVA